MYAQRGRKRSSYYSDCTFGVLDEKSSSIERHIQVTQMKN